MLVSELTCTQVFVHVWVCICIFAYLWCLRSHVACFCPFLELENKSKCWCSVNNTQRSQQASDLAPEVNPNVRSYNHMCMSASGSDVHACTNLQIDSYVWISNCRCACRNGNRPFSNRFLIPCLQFRQFISNFLTLRQASMSTVKHPHAHK